MVQLFRQCDVNIAGSVHKLKYEVEFSPFADMAFMKHCIWLTVQVRKMRREGYSEEVIKRWVYANSWYR